MRGMKHLPAALFGALAATGALAQTVTLTSPANGARIDLNQTGTIIEVEWSYAGGTPVDFTLWVNGADIGFSCGWGGGTGSCFFDATDTVCAPVLQIRGLFVIGGTRYSAPIQVFFYQANNPASLSCLPNAPQCAGDQAGGSVGGPINVVTGNMHYEVEDIVVPSPLPIRVTRRFDSPPSYSGPLGAGFRHRYDTRMECGTDPNGLGQHCKYTDSENNVTYQGRTATGASPVWYSLYTAAFNGTQLTEPQQTKYNFSGGKLTSIQDRNGNTLSFAYDGGGKLMSITDTFNRQVTFGYTGSLVTSVTRPDGEQILYGYTGSKLTSVTYPDGVVLSYEYTDAAHPNNLTAVKDQYGHVLESWSYDAQNRAMTYAKEAGVEALTLAYDTPMANKTQVTDALGNVTTYTVDKLRKVVTDIVGPCQSCGGGFNEQHFLWDTFQRITQVTDGKGAITELQWDNSSPIKFRNLTRRIEAKSTPLQRTTYLCYHATYNLVTTTKVKSVGTCTISDTCGVTTTDHSVVINTYNAANGDLTSRQVKGCEGAVAKTYTTSYSYDSKGQLLTADGPRTDAVPEDVTTYTYYPSGNPQYGFLATETNALGHVTEYLDYDQMGRPGTIVDPNDVETSFTYDEMGRTATTTIHGDTPAEDIVTSYTYDDHVGHLETVTNPRGYMTTYTEDTAHRLTDVTDPPGNVAHTDYDLMSQRVREEYRDDLGAVQNFTNFAYDGFHRLEHVCFTGAVADCPGAAVHTTLTYDGNGNLMTEEDAEGHVTSYTHDALNRLDTVTQTAGAETLVTDYGYDVQDNATSVQDPEGLAPTTYSYSDTGWRLQAVSPDTGTTTHTYDAAGNLKTTLDANGVTVTMAYDSLNRLTTTTYPNASLNVSRSYDSPSVNFGIGRRTGMTDPSGTAVYHYDRRGLPKKEAKTIGGATYTTEYDFDKNGNLSEILYPADHPLRRQGQVNWVHDAADRVTAVTAKVNGSTATVASSILYKPFGPHRSITFGNGLLDTRSYDTRYRLGTWTLGGLLSYSHAHDDDDNVTTRTDLIDPTKNRIFGYDEVHRLTAAEGPWGPGTACTAGATYEYDRNGNRLCKGEQALPVLPTMYTHVPNANRLATAAGGEPAVYVHDNNGNLTEDGTLSYIYSHANRLEEVEDALGGTIATYTYDGDGRRVIRDAGGTTTYYFYDPSGTLLTETVAAAETGKDYIYLGDMPLARVDWTPAELSLGNVLRVAKPDMTNVRLDWTLFASPSGDEKYLVRRKQVVDPDDKSFDGSVVIAEVEDPAQIYNDPVLADGNRYDYQIHRRVFTDALLFYHTDHLGTPIAMTGGGGGFVWRAEHFPFGGVHSLPVALIENNLRFPGQYFDDEAGVHENWFREQIPALGRYLSPDPFLDRSWLEPTPYPYVRNRPTALTDPFGLFAVQDSCDCNKELGGQITRGVAAACSYLRRPACASFLTKAPPFNKSSILPCLQRRCEDKTPIACNKDPYCGAFLFGAILVGAGEGGCPKDKGLGYGPTVFHEAIHSCGLVAEPYGEGPLSRLFNAYMRVCAKYDEREGRPVP